MKNIRIQNLRSLVDTTAVDIKPLTVLLGKNSGGKSTFLRSFPLLRQSSEQKTVNDILWFGDYVDFGSFAESLNKSAAQRAGRSEIAFRFELEQPIDTYRFSPRMRRALDAADHNSFIQKYVFQLKQITETDKIDAPLYSEYTVEADGNIATLTVDQDLVIKRFTINSEDVLHLFQDSVLLRQKKLLPAMSLGGSGDDAFEKRLFDFLQKIVPPELEDEIHDIGGSVYYGPPNFIQAQLRELRRNDGWIAQVNEWKTDSDEILQIGRLLFAIDFENIFDNVNAILTSTFSNVRYITPLRASAERYYRLQGLAVDEISPNGENLAMYLKSLSEAQADAFAKWTAEHMGFSVRVESHAGHVSIVIENSSDGSRVNLADVGFGYSQVIPILAQMWQIQRSRKRIVSHLRRNTFQAPTFFLIEQPELHLHPKMQGKLAELLFRSSITARRLGIDLRIIIETHSETMIAKLGNLIATSPSISNDSAVSQNQSDFSKDDVGIYLFDQETSGLSSTKILKSGFDQNGLLTNWPYDFFDGVQ